MSNKFTPIEDEIAAMQEIIRVLAAIDPGARLRVVGWVKQLECDNDLNAICDDQKDHE